MLLFAVKSMLIVIIFQQFATKNAIINAKSKNIHYLCAIITHHKQ